MSAFGKLGKGSAANATNNLAANSLNRRCIKTLKICSPDKQLQPTAELKNK